MRFIAVIFLFFVSVCTQAQVAFWPIVDFEDGVVAFRIPDNYISRGQTGKLSLKGISQYGTAEVVKLTGSNSPDDLDDDEELEAFYDAFQKNELGAAMAFHNGFRMVGEMKAREFSFKVMNHDTIMTTATMVLYAEGTTYVFRYSYDDKEKENAPTECESFLASVKPTRREVASVLGTSDVLQAEEREFGPSEVGGAMVFLTVMIVATVGIIVVLVSLYKRRQDRGALLVFRFILGGLFLYFAAFISIIAPFSIQLARKAGFSAPSPAFSTAGAILNSLPCWVVGLLLILIGFSRKKSNVHSDEVR